VFGLPVADHRFDGGAALHLAFDGGSSATNLAGDPDPELVRMVCHAGDGECISLIQSGETQVRVAVIGGGIGGLATALSPHAAGIDVDVYEAVASLKPLGVGINLLPHAVRELTELGLADHWHSWELPPRHSSMRTSSARRSGASRAG
jgi:hypothetical protein